MGKAVNWVFGLVALIALGAGVFLQQYKPAPTPPRSALVYPVPKQLAPFQLTDQNGQVFDQQRLKGKWSLLFAGYTFCPDICPTTLLQLKRAHQQVGLQDQLQVVLVSVDPKRDTQQKLKQYMDYFNPEFVAVRGEHPQLYPLTQQLGLVYAMNGDDPEDYQVDHSAAVALINPQGQLVALLKPKDFKPGELAMVKADDVAHDVGVLIEAASL
ncbi:SCO family protein [Paraferrimonas sedimenticola]|uniref:Electron transporter SenC n=1 Tax=Paraferrimonas sedimenticola TaxID=375674 RepID=A0AA37W059_9GAMM|nr:SCO family protein [Paraferrimonas sedimenticola]GLP95950.1 electron transporter SenC [Paraferrimonas sedimenticola]